MFLFLQIHILFIIYGMFYFTNLVPIKFLWKLGSAEFTGLSV